jgi:tRNA (guanosine-2'-O-)-methyltransferase
LPELLSNKKKINQGSSFMLPFFLSMTATLIKYLENFITDNRKALFHAVLKQRTRYITVVLEDIFQAHNASAVLRTCDCFGIQDVHLIENRNKFSINEEIALGSEKWLTLKTYSSGTNNILDAIATLRKNGYRIIATTPHQNDTNLNDFDLTSGKTALLFGTELRGLSEDALNNADGYLKIPMHGFTESFNISVTAAIILHALTEKLRASEINWQLSEKESDEVMLSWLQRSVKNSALIEKEFIARQLKLSRNSKE